MKPSWAGMDVHRLSHLGYDAIIRWSDEEEPQGNLILEAPWLEDIGVHVFRKKVEEVEKELFTQLGENDILRFNKQVQQRED